MVFWFGDLNYRIGSSMSPLDVLAHAQARRLQVLADNDQLNGAREAGDAFEDFHEGEDEGRPKIRLGNARPNMILSGTWSRAATAASERRRQ